MYIQILESCGIVVIDVEMSLSKKFSDITACLFRQTSSLFFMNIASEHKKEF